ncbi:UvrD-helicase domain-containing protein [Komagataeibacter rhaeticus]|nr:UvrD-helicase domain-containing protein [Komagataeibacter rhaeticus]
MARRLFVEDGMNASDIATRLGAPFDVVAQQLLDALLLPPFAPPTPEERVKRPLNEGQGKAALHRGEAYLLEAGPGTGKTQTLVGRVESLLAEGMDPRRILLLTFSNKAAGEMAERIARENPEAAAAMWIGTFHAFGLDLVRRFHDRLDLPDDPRMLDKTEAVELLEDEFPASGSSTTATTTIPRRSLATSSRRSRARRTRSSTPSSMRSSPTRWSPPPAATRRAGPRREGA